jgi:cytochrome c
MRLLRAAVVASLALASSLLLARVHPFGDAGLNSPSAAPAQVGSIPPDVRGILMTKCADCHSTQPHVPAYGRFAPISWLLERDIVKARGAINLSQWDTYSADQQETFKAKIVQETKTHDMPLPQYRMIHWNSRITAADLRTLTQWAHDPRASAADSSSQATTQGDPVRGQLVFEKRCTGCHALTQNHEGPRLEGVYGRATASVANFPYSDALRNAHLVWNDQSLEKWLTDPDAFVPGGNMDFRVVKPQERKDLIAYFKQSAGS